MTLPFTTVQTISTTGAGEGLTSAFQKSVANDAGLYQNEVAIDARVTTLETLLSVPFGAYVPPAGGGFVYSSKAAGTFYTAANAGTELTGTTNQAIQTTTGSLGGILDVFTIPQTFNGLPVVIMICAGSGGYLYMFAFNVPAYTTVSPTNPLLLSSQITTNTSLAFSASYSKHQITGPATFKVMAENSPTPTSVDITFTGSAFTIGSGIAQQQLDGSAAVVNPNTTRHRGGFFHANASWLSLGERATYLLPCISFEARGVSGSASDRVSIFPQSNFTPPSDTFCDLDQIVSGSPSYYVMTGPFRQPGGTQMIAHQVIGGDDTGMATKNMLKANLTGVIDVQVTALAPNLVVSSMNTSGSGRVMQPLLLNNDADGIPVVSNGLPSPFWANSGGFALPLFYVHRYSATQGYMGTVESGVNAFALRGFQYTPSVSGSTPTLLETGSPVPFSLGSTIDATAGGMQTPKACRVGTDQVFVASCSSAATGATTKSTWAARVLNPS